MILGTQRSVLILPPCILMKGARHGVSAPEKDDPAKQVSPLSQVP